GQALHHDQRNRGHARAPVRPEQVAEQPPAPRAQQRGQPGADLLRLLRGYPPPRIRGPRHPMTSNPSTSIRSAYSRFEASRSRWLPVAAIVPPDSSATLSASATVDGRCATTRAVEPARISCSALVTRSSV